MKYSYADTWRIGNIVYLADVLPASSACCDSTLETLTDINQIKKGSGTLSRTAPMCETGRPLHSMVISKD